MYKPISFTHRGISKTKYISLWIGQTRIAFTLERNKIIGINLAIPFTQKVKSIYWE
jgi:hypothetical protein